MTPEDRKRLEAIEGRHSFTFGDWYANLFVSPRGARRYWCVGDRKRGSQQICRDVHSEHDAEFIAHAPADIAWLIERVKSESERVRAARIDECERALREDAAFEKPRFFYLQDRLAELRSETPKEKA